MKKTAVLLFICLALLICSTDPARNDPGLSSFPDYPNETWETISNPDSAGWSLEKLQAARSYSQTILTAAVMIIHDGKVLYQWGETAQKFNMHSCRKSLLSALYGSHVQNGNIDLNETMTDLRINDNPSSLTSLERTATVRMLLKARSGIYHPAAYESAGMKAARPERYSHAPGTFWYYNNWDFNVLGTIFEQETGTKIHEEFKRLIGDPIGMEDFDSSDGFYVYEDVSIHPAYPFRMTARDVARFGLLCLRNGKWKGKQIIPESWIRESTTSYSDAGYAGGYGYMWWVAVNGRHFPEVNLEDGAYSARGWGGQYLVVIPDMDLVVVHRVNTDLGYSQRYSEFGLLFAKILDAKKH